ncbi:MAG: PhoH family protein [Nanobdellota archaeon]
MNGKETLDEAVLEELQQQRKQGKIGLRVPDTNVAMQNPSFIYLLTGNLHQVEDFDESVNNSPFAETLLQKYQKSPHDLLLPWHVHRELDRIKDSPRKDSNTKYQARAGQKAINDILRLPQLLEDEENFSFREVISGNEGITLENGANVYFIDLNKEDIKKYHGDSSEEVTNDLKIIYSIEKFLDNHKNYKNTKFITDDTGASNEAIIRDIKTEAFRFEQVKNPLQSNPGKYEVEQNLTQARKSINKDIIELDDPSLGLELNAKYLPAHTIIKLEGKDRRTNPKNQEVISQHRVFKPDTQKLHNLDHFDEFYDFFKERMYNTENPQKKAEENKKDTKIAFDHTQRKNIGYFKEMLNTLAEQGKISDKEFQTHLNMIDSKKVNSGKKSNLKKKIEKTFSQFENRGLISTSEDAIEPKNNSIQRYKDILKYQFNPRLIPQGEQRPYLDHLLDPNIRVFSLDAKGGFGKTLWALTAGLYQINQGKYDKILYVTSLADSEGGVGYLPGPRDTKIAPKVEPARQALIELFSNPEQNNPTHTKEITDHVNELKNEGIVNYDVISDMKGTTFTNTYGIIDEAHLYTRDELGLLLGRFGHGSKVIVLSAIEQFKSSTKYKGDLNERTTGVAHLAEKLTSISEKEVRDAYAHMAANPSEIYRGMVPKMAARLLDRKTDFLIK